MMTTTTSFTQMTTEIVFHMATHQVHGFVFIIRSMMAANQRHGFYAKFGGNRCLNFFCHIKGGGKTWVRRLLLIMVPYLVVMLSMTKIAKSLRRLWNVFLGDSSQSPVSIEDMGETPVVRFLYNLPFMIFVFKLGLKRSFGSRFVMLVRHHHQWGEVSEETRKK